MQHSSTGVEVSASGTSQVAMQDTSDEDTKPTTQVVTSASAAAVTEDIQAQLEKDKLLIYGHPLFPLMAQLFEKCEQATQSTDPPTSASFDVDIEEFVHRQDRAGKPFFSNDHEIDNLMVKAIQVLRIHLLELEKVNELCKDFCHRYITCLKGKMHSDILLRDERQPGTPYAQGQMSQDGQGSSQGQDMTPPHQVTQQVQASPQQVHPVPGSSVGAGHGAYILQQPNSQASHQTGSAQLQQAQFQTMLNQAGQVVYAPVIPQGVMAQQGLVTQAIPGTVQLQSTPQQGVGHAQSVVPVIHGSTPISHIGIPTSVSTEQHTITSLAYTGNATSVTNTVADDYDDMNDLLNKRKPKRGVLPKHATNIMRSWLFQHIVHPYPTEDEKRMIAAQTNLTLLQVNNWFINARRRILQPMLDASNPDPSAKTKKVKTQSRPSTQRFWPESLANLSSPKTTSSSSDVTASTALTPSVLSDQITLSGDALSSMVRVHHSPSPSQLEAMSNGEGVSLTEERDNGSDLSSNDSMIGLDSDDDSS